MTFKAKPRLAKGFCRPESVVGADRLLVLEPRASCAATPATLLDEYVVANPCPMPSQREVQTGSLWTDIRHAAPGNPMQHFISALTIRNKGWSATLD
jgi:hypothetical protein